MALTHPYCFFMTLYNSIISDVPNLLTLLGVFVAILPAIYSARSARAAYWQAKSAEASVAEVKIQSKHAQEAVTEARRQNNISGHSHRIDAYRAFLAFRRKVSATGVGFGREVIWSLWEHVEVADFYFSKETVNQLSQLIDAAFANQSSHDELKNTTDFNPGAQKKLKRPTSNTKKFVNL